jgi:hypothetical protein
MNRPLNANTDANPEQPIEPQLSALLDTLRTVPPRDPQAASRGRAAFLAVAAQHKTRRAGVGVIGTRWLMGARRAFAAVLRPAFALVIVFTTIALGGASVVFASQSSLPDEPLYPVKVWSEDARLSLANNTNDRLSLLIEFANRRKAELNALQTRQMQPSPLFYERFGDQVDAALSLGGADASLQEDDRAELESLRDQINPIPPTALPQPTPTPTPSATPMPSATATVTPPPTDTPAPIVAPSDTPVIIEASATAEALPTRARRDDIRATLTALPLPQPPPEPRPDARATRDASPRPEPPPMPDVRATLDALPTQAPPPQPDIKATRDAIEDGIRATLDALPTPEPPPPPPPPPAQQPPERPERPERPEPPERRPRP